MLPSTPSQQKHGFGYAKGLPFPDKHHKDPFDPLMIAQSRVEIIPVVPIDARFDAYGVNR